MNNLLPKLKKIYIITD